MGPRVAKSPTSGNDSVSPDGGRFAKIYRDEWICTEVDAEGYDDLELSYYWRGDSDSEGSGESEDDGIVEYRTSGSCTSSSGWETLQNHDMSVDSSWSTQSAFDLPSELNDSEFLLRFRADSTANDEYLRIDGVLLIGEEIDYGTISGYKYDQNEDGVEDWNIWLYDHEEEATEDIHQFGGQATLEDSYFQTSVMTLFRKRAGWLVILFIGGTLTAGVIRAYESFTISMSWLVFFLPLIVSAGGNTGSQSASLVIRGLAVREMELRDWVNVIWR